ncbi:hypothetical protein B0H19DRAFT_1376996 [Mycena capillaripes]|nr:hypothetical protein B0H19DRAFT_1376996 [Mycena capillaripes]
MCLTPTMPPRHHDILEYTAAAAHALREMSVVAQIPFVNSVCALSLTIIPIVQSTKFQQERCVRMVEGVHRMLCVLTSLCVSSEDIRSPKMLAQIGHYATTLQRFYSYLRAQRELGAMKRLLKQSEIAAQLDNCEKELGAASDIFMMEYGVGIANAVVELNDDIERRHQELLELISSQSELPDNDSSLGWSSLNTSSGSLSLLPAYPKIFHGRDAEVQHLTETLLGDLPRVVVLGPGGMGKSTLAMAALHHPAVIEQYPLRHFISCESAYTLPDLVSDIELHLVLRSSGQTSKAIVRHFQKCGPCLVVLDNLETPWEPLNSRGRVEDFLLLLASIPTLALLITMRGAERPGKVKWTRPFLAPLEPLSTSASRQIFSDIADEPSIEEESTLTDLLDSSGRLPLAVTLMANIASFEGYSGTLSRWKVENTGLLSDGRDKRSNLEKSITLSLGSPRIASSPDAKNLLALLSLLPDGIRPEDIMAGKVPIPNVLHCQSLLVRTSLAYMDLRGRLKALSPIREFIRLAHPPTPSLAQPLRVYFQDLLELWKAKNGQLPSGNLAPNLVAHLGNINEVLLYGLSTDEKAAGVAIGHSIITLHEFSMIMLRGASPLIKKLPDLIDGTGDSALRWRYASACLRNPTRYPAPDDPEILIKDFEIGSHPSSQAITFYNSAARYYWSKGNIQRAAECNKRALALAEEAGDIKLRLSSLSMEYNITMDSEDPSRALKIAQKAQHILDSGGHYEWSKREANAECYLGNLPRALELCIEADELMISVGMEGSDKYLTLLDIRAEVHFRKSEYLQARQLHERIVKKTSPTSSPMYHANSLVTMVHLDILTERDGAEISANLNGPEYEQAVLSSPRWTLPAAWVAAETKLYRGDIDHARRAFTECLTKSRGVEPAIMHMCLTALGDPRHRMHGTAGTLRWAVVYLAFVQKMKDPVGTPNALRFVADSLDYDEETALSLFHVALNEATRMDIHRLRAECMAGIGDIYMHRGDPMGAKEMWRDAHPLFVRSYRSKEATSVVERLQKLLEI